MARKKTSAASDKLIELELADEIKYIARREILALKNTGSPLGKDEIAALERLTKVYTMLMSDHRENLKAGVFDDIVVDD